MGDRLQPHAMCRLGGEGRAPAAGAEKHKPLVLGKERLVIGAFRIDPEFEHAARAMKRAGYATLAFKLAWIAQIDKVYVVAAVQRDRLFDR